MDLLRHFDLRRSLARKWREAVVTLDGERFSLRLRVFFGRHEVFVRLPVSVMTAPISLSSIFSQKALPVAVSREPSAQSLSEFLCVRHIQINNAFEACYKYFFRYIHCSRESAASKTAIGTKNHSGLIA